MMLLNLQITVEEHKPAHQRKSFCLIWQRSFLAYFFTFLTRTLRSGGSESCDLSTVQVQQTNTGQKHGYDPIFEVEVKNLCRCELTNVYLWSEGFASSMSVDPKLFRQEGSGFLVNDGKGIPSLMSVKFQYAWDRAYKMTPSAMQEDCAGERNRCEELLLGNKWLPGAGDGC
ncbi:TPD1 protein homolog 1B isoform X2 [Elaeis guineensis]|uniref:TPD1 protein homolog 1B isoform X2 n=1 Tax=Elaeis guineensis var. tenera TaxID=51953 RepID=UPI003C6CDE2C